LIGGGRARVRGEKKKADIEVIPQNFPDRGSGRIEIEPSFDSDGAGEGTRRMVGEGANII